MASLDAVTVKEYMNTQIVTLTPDTDVMAAINTFIRRGIGSAPVLDDGGTLVGMLSEKDLLKFGLTAAFDGVQGGPIKEFMTAGNIVSVSPETPIMQVASMFVDSNFKRFPVIQNGKLVGLVSRQNVLRAINDHS